MVKNSEILSNTLTWSASNQTHGSSCAYNHLCIWGSPLCVSLWISVSCGLCVTCRYMLSSLSKLPFHTRLWLWLWSLYRRLTQAAISRPALNWLYFGTHRERYGCKTHYDISKTNLRPWGQSVGHLFINLKAADFENDGMIYGFEVKIGFNHNMLVQNEASRNCPESVQAHRCQLQSAGLHQIKEKTLNSARCQCLLVLLIDFAFSTFGQRVKTQSRSRGYCQRIHVIGGLKRWHACSPFDVASVCV